MLSPGKTEAQFTTATQSDVVLSGVSPVSRSVGNDIYDNGTDLVAVSTWGDTGSSPGISWEVSGSVSSTGYTTFTYTSNIVWSDVCLVFDGHDTWAIAVYHDASSSGTYYWEYFLWSQSGSVWGFYSQAVASFASGTFHHSLFIDSDDHANFAIVWDTDQDKVNIITGSQSTSAPILNNSGNAVTISSDGSDPDVSIFNGGSAPQHIVHIAYLQVSNKHLIVESHLFNDLASGSLTSSPGVLNETPSSGDFYHPRIACPGSSGTSDDWTVVAERSDNINFWNIIGFNSDGGTIGSEINYNDGSISTAAISGQNNYLPTVTYDNSINVWVAWILDDLQGTYVYPAAIIPLGLQLNGQATGSSLNYWEVPTNLIYLDEFLPSAISSRYGNSDLYLTYHYVTGSQIWSKIIDLSSSPSSFKTITKDDMYTSNTLTSIGLISKHLIDGPIKINLIDVTGRIVLSRPVYTLSVLNDLVYHSDLKPSIYVLEAHDLSDNTFIGVTKIVVQY